MSSMRDTRKPLIISQTLKVHIRPQFLVLEVVKAKKGDHLDGSPSTQFYPLPLAALRDACSCHRCVDPSTRQKNFTSGYSYSVSHQTASLDHDSRKETVLAAVKSAGETVLEVQWPGEVGKSSVYTEEDLRALISQPDGDSWTKRELWDCPRKLTLDHDPLPTFDYLEITKKDAGPADVDKLRQMLRVLQSKGIVMIKGVPTVETSDERCTLREVVEWIGHLRKTFYGDTWDVINLKSDSRNVAYTDKDLGLHMDLLYCTEPPRFQLLHCLRNRVSGGSSYFVDSFAAALIFGEEQLGHYLTLRGTPIPFHYENDSHHYRNNHPVLPDNLFQLRSKVCWSPPFQDKIGSFVSGQESLEAALDCTMIGSDLFPALNAWDNLINEPSRRVELTMQEGDLIIFDNLRILHARRGFRELTEREKTERGVEVKEGEPSRWLKGCYIDGDVVWDKLAVLSKKSIEV